MLVLSLWKSTFYTVVDWRSIVAAGYTYSFNCLCPSPLSWQFSNSLSSCVSSVASTFYWTFVIFLDRIYLCQICDLLVRLLKVSSLILQLLNDDQNHSLLLSMIKYLLYLILFAYLLKYDLLFLVMYQPIWRSPSLYMHTPVRKCCIFDNYISWCGKVQ